jgi:hypothetical protein
MIYEYTLTRVGTEQMGSMSEESKLQLKPQDYHMLRQHTEERAGFELVRLGLVVMDKKWKFDISTGEDVLLVMVGKIEKKPHTKHIPKKYKAGTFCLACSERINTK